MYLEQYFFISKKKFLFEAQDLGEGQVVMEAASCAALAQLLSASPG